MKRSRSKLKILLSDLPGIERHFGAQALALSLMDEIKKFRPAEFTILVSPRYYRDNITLAERLGYRIIAEPIPLNVLGMSSRFFRLLDLGRSAFLTFKGKEREKALEKKRFEVFRRAVQTSDLVIDADGIEFIGNKGFLWKFYDFVATIYTQEAAEHLRTRYFKYTKSYGPLRGWLYKRMVKKQLEKLPFVFVRSGASEGNLRELQRLNLKNSLYSFPDVSLSLSASSAKWAQKYLSKNCRIDCQKPILGLSPSAVIASLPNMASCGRNHIRLCLKIIKFFQKKTQILIIPHSFGDGKTSKSSDLILAREIFQKIPEKKNIFLLDDPSLNYREARAIIGMLDFCVTGRFHAVVSCLATGVPVVPLSWHVKYHDLISLYPAHFRLIDSRRLSVTNAFALIREAYENRKWFEKTKILKRNAVLKKQINRSVEIIFDFLEANKRI